MFTTKKKRKEETAKDGVTVSSGIEDGQLRGILCFILLVGLFPSRFTTYEGFSSASCCVACIFLPLPVFFFSYLPFLSPSCALHDLIRKKVEEGNTESTGFEIPDLLTKAIFLFFFFCSSITRQLNEVCVKIKEGKKKVSPPKKQQQQQQQQYSTSR